MGPTGHAQEPLQTSPEHGIRRDPNIILGRDPVPGQQGRREAGTAEEEAGQLVEKDDRAEDRDTANEEQGGPTFPVDPSGQLLQPVRAQADVIADVITTNRGVKMDTKKAPIWLLGWLQI